MRRAKGRVGGKPQAMRDIHPPQRQRRCCGGRVVKASRRPPIRPLPVRLRDRNGGFPRLSARGRTASRMACVALHRRATRSWPKALGSRLYGSILRTFGIMPGKLHDRLGRDAAVGEVGDKSPSSAMARRALDASLPVQLSKRRAEGICRKGAVLLSAEQRGRRTR